MKTVNLRPDDNGYEQIARVLLDSTLADIGPDRRTPAGAVLSGLVELCAYLATVPDGAQRIARLQRYAERR